MKSLSSGTPFPILVLFSALIALVSHPTAAIAATESDAATRFWYVGLEGGMGVYNGFNPSIPGVGDTGFEVGGAATLRVGRVIREHWRLESELAWNGSSIDSIAGRVDVLSWTDNLYYDFGPRDAFIRPYLGVGVGVGFGWLESNLANAAPFLTNRSGVGFSYVIEGGGRFRLSDRLMATAAWHFLGTAALINNGTGGSISPTMHAFMVGLQHEF